MKMKYQKPTTILLQFSVPVMASTSSDAPSAVADRRDTADDDSGFTRNWGNIWDEI